MPSTEKARGVQQRPYIRHPKYGVLEFQENLEFVGLLAIPLGFLACALLY
jgi:hypothetical protein